MNRCWTQRARGWEERGVRCWHKTLVLVLTKAKAELAYMHAVSAYHLPMRVLGLLLPVHLSVRHHCSGMTMRRWLLLLRAVRPRLLGAARIALRPELHERHDSRDEVDRLSLGA